MLHGDIVIARRAAGPKIAAPLGHSRALDWEKLNGEQSMAADGRAGRAFNGLSRLALF